MSNKIGILALLGVYGHDRQHTMVKFQSDFNWFTDELKNTVGSFGFICVNALLHQPHNTSKFIYLS